MSSNGASTTKYTSLFKLWSKARPVDDDTATAPESGGPIGATSFEQYIDAERKREEAPEAYREALEKFQKERGRISESFVCKNFHAGVVIIDAEPQYRLKVAYHGPGVAQAGPSLGKVLWRARADERQGAEILEAKPRRILTQSIYQVLCYLLSVVDYTHSDQNRDSADEKDARIAEAVRASDSELQRLSVFAEQSARRASVRHYLFGLPFGVIISALLAYVLYAVGKHAWQSAELQVAGGCLLTGALGATISVITRASDANAFDVDYQQTRGNIRLAGACRPIIGAVFGAVIYLFASSGLIPLDVTPETAPGIQAIKPTLISLALGFLAGFSERWAHDVILSGAPSTSPFPEATPGPEQQGAR